VKRENLFEGYMYVAKGAGPGDFSDLKRRFIVEKENYSIHVFSDENVRYL